MSYYHAFVKDFAEVHVNSELVVYDDYRRISLYHICKEDSKTWIILYTAYKPAPFPFREKEGHLRCQNCLQLVNIDLLEMNKALDLLGLVR